jgi:hypothetical protein
MRVKTNSIGVLERFAKTLQGFAGFIISPWLNGASVKPLQERIYFLEQCVYDNFPETEQRLEMMVDKLQRQIENLQESTNHRLDEIMKYQLPQQVLELLQEQSDRINETIKPTVEALMYELEEQRRRSLGSLSIAEVQARQDRLQHSLEQLEELTTSLPYLEVQRVACLEAGKWLLVRRGELAQEIADEILTPEHPLIEDFRHNLRKYLKLLGSCMENEIEPRLLYQGVINHQEPPVEMYWKAFQLMRDKVAHWESSAQISSQAAEELRSYFNYLIDYFMNALL